jgi:hypothetical protein
MNAFGKLVFSTVAAGVIGVVAAAIYKHGRKQGREDVAEVIKDPMHGYVATNAVRQMQDHGEYTPKKYQVDHERDMAKAAGMVVAAISGIAITTMWTIGDAEVQSQFNKYEEILGKISKSLCDVYRAGNDEKIYQDGRIEAGSKVEWRTGGVDGIIWMQERLAEGPVKILEDMGRIVWTTRTY